jgi:peptide/nickel transport system substrate-binding protein
VGKRGGHPNASTTHTVFHWGIHECPGIDNSCLAHPAPNYNGLVEYNPETDNTDDIRGDLATTWDLGDDGVTYTFKLHPDAVWNDGMPVTAEDVVFSFERMVDREDKIVRAKVHVIRPFYESSRVIDTHTVEIKTLFPAPAFLPFIAAEYFKILPKHHVEAIKEGDNGADQDGDMKPFENINGSGPFRVVSFEKDVSIEYVRNENYFKDPYPYFDAMTYYSIVDEGTTAAAFRAQQTLFHTHPNNAVSTRTLIDLAEDMQGIARVVWVGPIAPLWMLLNIEREPFTDPRVRHAISLATHRQPIIESLSAGVDELGGVFPPSAWFGYTKEELETMPGYRLTADGEKHPDDIAEAKRLLEEAGVPSDFSTSTMAIPFSGFDLFSSIFADQLRTFLGWEVESSVLELQTFVQQRNAGQFEMSSGGYGILVNDPHDIIGGVLQENGSTNIMHWRNDRIEEIYELQAEELDRVKRKALADEVSDIIIKIDSPYIFLYHTMRGHFANNKINNLHKVATLTDALKAEHFWCDPEC